MRDAFSVVALIFLSVFVCLPASFLLGRHGKDKDLQYSTKDVLKFFLILAGIAWFLVASMPEFWQIFLAVYGLTPFLYWIGRLSRRKKRLFTGKLRTFTFGFYSWFYKFIRFINVAYRGRSKDE